MLPPAKVQNFITADYFTVGEEEKVFYYQNNYDMFFNSQTPPLLE